MRVPRVFCLLALFTLFGAACDGDDSVCEAEQAEVRDVCTGELSANEPLFVDVAVRLSDDFCGDLSCEVQRDVSMISLVIEQDGCKGLDGADACLVSDVVTCELPPLEPARYNLRVNGEGLGDIVVSEAADDANCRLR